jgi:hypothetical protein
VQWAFDRIVRVKPAGVVCDGWRVIFCSAQALNAGIVTSLLLLAVASGDRP